jgi:hypothetical protein
MYASVRDYLDCVFDTTPCLYYLILEDILCRQQQYLGYTEDMALIALAILIEEYDQQTDSLSIFKTIIDANNLKGLLNFYNTLRELEK